MEPLSAASDSYQKWYIGENGEKKELTDDEGSAMPYAMFIYCVISNVGCN